MNILVPLPIVLALLGAALSLAAHGRVMLQRVLSVVVMTGTVAASFILLARVEADGTVAVDIGAWPAPMGITLVVDLFAAIMLAISTTMVLAVLVYAMGSPRTTDEARFFHPVYLVLSAGVCASFLTGDLFNLFVAFEIMLTASYVLITLGGRLEQVRSGMTYVVISLLASVLFVALLAFVYASTGTMNLADLSSRIAELPDGLRSALAVLMLVVFGIKAAIFPLFFWLPDSYPTAPSPVTAIFAGLLTKVGVYAIIRTQTLLFPADTRPTTLLLVLAGATMLVGVLGAIAQGDVKRILSFQIISHIGYMIMGLGLFTVGGIAAAVLYTIHHIVAKTGLFLSGGLIEHAGGSSRLTRLGGMVRTAPVLAVLFLVPALSLIGLPPFSGFVAKFALVDAASERSSYGVMTVALVVSLLTMYSLMKIWISVFWSPATESAPAGAAAREQPGEPLGGPLLMVAPTVVLAALTVVIGLAAGPLYDLSLRAAADLLEPSAYLEVVRG